MRLTSSWWGRIGYCGTRWRDYSGDTVFRAYDTTTGWMEKDMIQAGKSRMWFKYAGYCWVGYG